MVKTQNIVIATQYFFWQYKSMSKKNRFFWGDNIFNSSSKLALPTKKLITGAICKKHS